VNNSTLYDEARAVAGNLASLWNRGRPVLERLEAADESAPSPWAALERLGPQGLETLFADRSTRQELSSAFQRLTHYLTAETWFDRAAREDERLEALQRAPVAYFCAEFALASWLPMYSGGLGVLAGDVLKESSDMGLPLVGVGLFYRHGFFSQRLDETDYQHEVYPTLDPHDLPLSRALDKRGNPLLIDVPVGDRRIHVCVWQLQVGRTSLYLLDSNVPENELQEDRDITSNLYGGDQETRIRQELVLGVGGARALRALGIEPSVFSMNEGHAAFRGLELLADELEGADFQTALQRARQRVVYTNHTVVPAGNDVFPRDLVQRYLGQYAEQRGIGVDRLLGLATNADGSLSMAVLAFQMAGKANAVSRLHGEVVPRQWPGFAVEAVTNGVHVPSWVGPEMTELVAQYVPDWQTDSPNWESVQGIPEEELQAARSAQRRRLVQFVNRVQTHVKLDPDALTLVWARRFAEYKRAGLLAADMGRLSRLLGDTSRPVQVVLSGKAHPRDEGGKRDLQSLLHRLREDASVASRVAFVEDYNLDVARLLTQGADVWVNTPRKPLEASGTSGMKASDNGGVQLTVRDGWAAEVDWWEVGWGITGLDNASDEQELYRYLEDGIVPCFYNRDETGIGRAWTKMMKNSMVLTLSRYSARRMMLEYVEKLYLPLLAEHDVATTSGV